MLRPAFAQPRDIMAAQLMMMNVTKLCPCKLCLVITNRIFLLLYATRVIVLIEMRRQHGRVKKS